MSNSIPSSVASLERNTQTVQNVISD